MKQGEKVDMAGSLSFGNLICRIIRIAYKGKVLETLPH